MIIRRWLGDTDFDGQAMRITYEDDKADWPTIKVDGQRILNAISADDVQGVVEYVKAGKIKIIRGNVEIRK